MNQNLKSNFMQRCVVTRDTRWWCDHCYEGGGTWFYPASIQQCVVWWGDNGGHWAHYLTNSADLYSDTTLNTSHVPGNCTRCPLHCWPPHLLGWEDRGINCTTNLHPEKELRNYVFLEIFSHSSSHPMQRTERRIMLCLGLYFVSSCKLEMS